jgi:ATP-dependent Clp protease ATP-binding subunit ClpX
VTLNRRTSCDVAKCSFCGKSKDDGVFIVAGPPDLFICDQCVDLCVEILRASRERGLVE